MARPRTNLDLSAVRAALKINGEQPEAVNKFIELVHMVEKLAPKEQILRAKNLTVEHIGLRLTHPSGREGFITDVEAPKQFRGVTFAQPITFDGDSQYDMEVTSMPSTSDAITVILDGKIVRLRKNVLVVLRETRDV